jgi:type II secretory pathway predicted ATPase ExeA
MNRNAIISHIERWKEKLGSYSAVAKKVNINVGALSTIMAGKYGADETKMLQRIAAALDYKDNDWKIVRSAGNYLYTERIFQDAKQESMWFAISNKAGSGKTAAMEDLYNQDHSGAVIFIQAEEWSGRAFMIRLIRKTMGEQALKGGYKTITEMLDMVVNYFNDMSLNRPILLIDEADKLRPAALRLLIPLYNRTEDRLGVILSGTENLEKEIRAGVRLHKKGYDELESRFGRSYMHLPGTTENDIIQICLANGLADQEAQARVWGELEKIKRQATVRTQTGFKDIMIEYVDDLRRVKRLVKRELLMAKRK